MVFLHVLECAQRFNSSPQLLRRQRRTARLSSFTSGDALPDSLPPATATWFHPSPAVFFPLAGGLGQVSERRDEGDDD